MWDGWFVFSTVVFSSLNVKSGSNRFALTIEFQNPLAEEELIIIINFTTLICEKLKFGLFFTMQLISSQNRTYHVGACLTVDKH